MNPSTTKGRVNKSSINKNPNVWKVFPCFIQLRSQMHIISFATNAKKVSPKTNISNMHHWFPFVKLMFAPLSKAGTRTPASWLFPIRHWPCRRPCNLRDGAQKTVYKQLWHADEFSKI